jgi:divalent metal cation (Fe/Co/Zn/Cd) transporter
MSAERAHQLAHDAEAHLISHLPRITEATIHASPAEAHP